MECNHEYEIIEDYNEKKKIIDWCCSCHISPPCGFCTTQVEKCKLCWDIQTETF